MEDNQIRKELMSIDIPKELNAKVKDGFMQAEKEMNSHSLKKKRNFKRNFFLWSSAAVIFIGLFIGSTFVSPAMATIASKIPFFNKVFNRGPIDEALLEHLKKLGFSIKGLSQSKNIISISVDQTQYSDHKKEVELEAEQFIQQQGYNHIEINVKKYSGNKIEKGMEHPLLNNDFTLEIYTKMKEAGFNTAYNTFTTKLDPPELTLVIPESDYKTRKNEIISIVRKAGETFEVGDFKISFETFTLENRERSIRWNDIISTLNEVLLNKKKYSISSFSSSVKDEVKLYVKLDIPAADSKAKEKANIIEQDIHEFLSSQKIKKILKDDHYQIVITSKDGKKIN